MERYSEYKDSGVKWLGQIPSHWEVRHLRNFLTLFSEKGFGNCQLLSVTRENGVILRDKDNKEENHNYVPDDLSGYKHLKAGDFVINKMKSWQGSYGVSDYEGIVSPAYFTCKLRGVIPSFFSRAIRSKAYVGFFMQYSKGIRVDQWDLDPNSMKDIPFVLPKEEEQDAIVAYLETATSKIDAAIAQQQKMIDLLNERKQIIINNAVTKGLDPDVPMKDSGIEWIGKIPEHWEISQLKRVVKLTNGDRGSNYPSGDDIKDYGVIFVTADNIHNLELDIITSAKYITEEKYNILRGAKLKIGDIIFCLRGAGYGNCAINKMFNSGTIASSLVCITPQGINSEFLNYVLHSNFLRDQENVSSNGSCADNVSAQDLGSYIVTIPPVSEQKDIVDAIVHFCVPIDEAVKCSEEMIKMLQERKQIIINDVVTGKVKVV